MSEPDGAIDRLLLAGCRWGASLTDANMSARKWQCGERASRSILLNNHAPLLCPITARHGTVFTVLLLCCACAMLRAWGVHHARPSATRTGITNYVSMDIMANTLLAAGASPAMVRGGGSCCLN